MSGEQPARHLADVQFQQFIAARRVGQREAATRTVAQQNIDVLSSEILKTLVFGQLERNDHDIRRRPFQADRPARQNADRNVGGLLQHARLDNHVGEGFGLADQYGTGRAFGRAHGPVFVLAVVNAARQQLRLAGAAAATAAAVRQRHAGAQSGVQNGFGILNRENSTGGFNADLV